MPAAHASAQRHTRNGVQITISKASKIYDIWIQVCSFEESMNRLKKVVYKNRVRVKDFLCDFDRLRTGSMYENHFISGLSIAGLDKSLSPQQIGTIVDAYRVQVTPSLSMIDWVSFVEDVDRIFTVKVCSTSPPLPALAPRCCARPPAPLWSGKHHQVRRYSIGKLTPSNPVQPFHCRSTAYMLRSSPR